MNGGTYYAPGGGGTVIPSTVLGVPTWVVILVVALVLWKKKAL